MCGTIGDRIRKLRLENSLTMDDLAKRVGYSSRASISRVEHGETDLPLSKVDEFAEALNTTPAYLMGWSDDPYNYDTDPDHRLDECSGPVWEHFLTENSYDISDAYHAYMAFQKARDEDALNDPLQDTYPIDLPEMIPIPVLGCIHAGDPVTAQECIEDTPVYIPKDWTTSGQLYRGLRVKGNSMLPKIQDGDRVIFRVTPECSSGDIVIARIDGDDATVKRFLKVSGIVTLQPLNSDYSPIIFTGDEAEPTLEILGVVVQLVRDL